MASLQMSSLDDAAARLRNCSMATRRTMEYHPPISKDFTFSAPALWQSKNNMMTWIADVEQQRDEPMEPLLPSVQRGRKHGPDADLSRNGHGKDEHRDKRAKHHPFRDLCGDPAQSRRSRILETTLHAANSVTSSINRATGSINRAINAIRPASLDGTTVAGSDSSPGTPCGTPSISATAPGTPVFSASPRRKLRFVFVGDRQCGKSSLLLRFHRNTFSQTHSPTQYELFNEFVEIDGQQLDCELWDTSGNIHKHQLGLLSYMSWDAVFLCYSVNSDKNYVNAQVKWTREIHKYCRNAPIILLGLKTDTRIGSGRWYELFRYQMDTRVSAAEGNMAAYTIRAIKYAECSAKTGQGVEKVFEDSIRLLLALQDGGAAEKQSKKPGLGEVFCFQ